MQSATSIQDAAPDSSRPLDVTGSIDRYQLQRLLAVGGGADVYAASHVHTGMQVVLKVPRDANPVTRARFEREIQALARLHGPGIVGMLDAGEADGKQFIAFRALEGRTLGGLLAARGRLSVADTVKAGVEMASALERCHAGGIVHRDVKPSNIFVSPGNAEQLTLLDFGIAKLKELPASAEKLTREHTLLGTPEYMAPESLLSSTDADDRVDVYGLGVTLYECLTGVVPFEGKYAELLLKLTTTVAPAVSVACPELTPALAPVIGRSLQRDPKDRYPTMRAMREALQACRDDADHVIDLFGRPGVPPKADAANHTLADSPKAKTNSPSGQFRRKHPRAPYIALARVTCANGERVDGRIEEVSEGGLQFVGDHRVDVGQFAKVRFSLPVSGRVCEASAHARWNRTVRGNNATGFEFSELSDAARAEIRQYVTIMCPDG